MRTLKKKKLIFANSLLALLMIVGCVYAWFAFNTQNTLDSNNVTIVSSNTLELSLDNKTWKNSINLTTDTAWFSDVKFTDITGSGNGSFLRPTVNQYSDHATVDSSAKWTRPIAGADGVQGDYAEITLYMRSLEALDIYLGEGSSVQPSAGSNTGVDNKLIGGANDTIINESPYSTSTFSFSKDIGVGAVRVSAVQLEVNGNASEHIFTWIPRPNIYFSMTTDESPVYDASTILIDAGETDYPDSYKHSYYAVSNNGLSKTDWDDAAAATFAGVYKITGDITNKNSTKLCTLRKNGESSYFENTVTFYIWLEGCDNEARRAFVGGKFNVKLNITAVQAETED